MCHAVTEKQLMTGWRDTVELLLAPGSLFSNKTDGLCLKIIQQSQFVIHHRTCHSFYPLTVTFIL